MSRCGTLPLASSSVQNASEGSFPCNPLRMIAGAASTNIAGPLPRFRMPETTRLGAPASRTVVGRPKSNAPSPSSQQRGNLDENLFSEDARRQYAALQGAGIRDGDYQGEVLTASTTFAGQHGTLRSLNWPRGSSKKKRSPGPISKDTRQEILSLIRQCEQQQRQRLLKTMQEDPAIGFPRAAVARWLVFAALAGFVFGGGLAYLLVPKSGRPDSRAAEAYIDTHTGKLVSLDSESEKHLAAAVERGDYQPAFYCWNCRQWLPVKNPQKPGTSVGRPPNALLNRPVAPQIDWGSEPRR